MDAEGIRVSDHSLVYVLNCCGGCLWLSGQRRVKHNGNVCWIFVLTCEKSDRSGATFASSLAAATNAPVASASVHLMNGAYLLRPSPLRTRSVERSPWVTLLVVRRDGKAQWARSGAQLVSTMIMHSICQVPGGPREESGRPARKGTGAPISCRV